MKHRTFKTLLIVTLLVLMLGSITAGANVPYTTYTYGVTNMIQESPAAYVPLTLIDSASLKFSLSAEGGASDNAKIKYGETFGTVNLASPEDIFVDDLNHVYISDTGNNRIVVTDEEYNVRLVISSFTNNYGVPDSLNQPHGLFVTESEIFVADKGNSRVVVFDKLGNFVTIVPEPASEVMPDNHVYSPVAVAVDSAGRIYVVSSTTNYGVLSLNRDGTFNGFVGAQKVTYSAFDYFWRMFQTAEQIAASEQYVPTEYNNIAIDEDDFVFVTTASIDENSVASAIQGKSKAADYMTVKKLNPKGSDVMNRNGFWPPAGEVDMYPMGGASVKVSGPSTVVDVAITENGTWSLIDTKRSKVFTYDANGNMLYAFGDFGDQLGNIQTLDAIDYQGTNILLLDKASASITVYKRTDYGDLIAAAIQNDIDQNYSKAVEYYTGILQRNNNYDTAYVGIGQALYRDGEYIEAMKYFRSAYDSENYSEAYQAYRKIWIEENLWIFLAVVVVCLVGFVKFFGFANKYNKKNTKDKEKRGFWEEVMYGFHIIFHPFDGFWDLKHEGRGSVRGAVFWLLAAALAFVYNAIGGGYLYYGGQGGGNYVMAAMSIATPALLVALANWCLTTLFDGEGTFKDVFITCCYSLVPLVMILFPVTAISNVLTTNEMGILTMLTTIAWVWVGLLVFFGVMVTHDYTLGKNFITILGTILMVCVIMFVAILFFALIGKIYAFGFNIYFEISTRL
ncbi:MAG: hypothetical protein E7651_00855 [Ruminococcaceae bacterium]|nr:hypothetical protein [Oscillospiraceae bacterium]